LVLGISRLLLGTLDLQRCLTFVPLGARFHPGFPLVFKLREFLPNDLDFQLILFLLAIFVSNPAAFFRRPSFQSLSEKQTANQHGEER
jgi:hypothetical protein